MSSLGCFSSFDSDSVGSPEVVGVVEVSGGVEESEVVELSVSLVSVVLSLGVVGSGS